MIKRVVFIIVVSALCLSISLPAFAAVTYSLVYCYVDPYTYMENGVLKVKPYVSTGATKPLDSISGAGDLYYYGTYQSNAYVALTNRQFIDAYGSGQICFSGDWTMNGYHYGATQAWGQNGWYTDYASYYSQWP